MKSRHPRVYPTEEMAAHAIVGGCRISGGDPIVVASGGHDPSGFDLGDIHLLSIEDAKARRYGISRARVYAAFALRLLYPEGNLSGMARMCGARGGVAHAYYSAVDQRLRRGDLPWFDQAKLDALVAEIRMPEVEPAESMPAKPAAPVKIAPAPARMAPAPVNMASDDDTRPIFDRGALGGIRKPMDRPRMSKSEMEADLRAAVQRTAAMQKSEK